MILIAPAFFFHYPRSALKDGGDDFAQKGKKMKIQESRWGKIDEKFKMLQSDIDLDNYLAPVNRSDELLKFKTHVSEGKVYNPVFEYDPLPEVYIKELEALRDDLNPDDPMEMIYLEAVNLRLGEIRAAQHHDARDITDITIQAYGKPDAAVIAVAENNLKRFKPDQKAYQGDVPGKIYDAEELAALCREAMTRYGFNWKVVVKKEMGAKAAVDNLIREFWIRSDVRFHESLVKMMIVHEIGTHVLRSENGYAQPLKIFGRGLPAYQFTEEGMAEYAEERSDCLMDDTVYRISGRVIGVQAALDGSFWDVYTTLKELFDVDMAFDIAQRAKLGLADTSQPGSYTKDYTYLAGLIKIKAFFQTASEAQINAILAGKVGFHHLESVMELQSAGYLLPPSVIPEWLPEKIRPCSKM